MGATKALVTVKKGCLLVYFNTVESVGLLLDRLFLSVGAELEDAVDDDFVARADLVTTALAAHRSCNVLADAAMHNLGLYPSCCSPVDPQGGLGVTQHQAEGQLRKARLGRTPAPRVPMRSPTH
ncbi:MAG: hypothetical protein ACKPKO_41580, partial [Candidatus Fonsibacter sp.]